MEEFFFLHLPDGATAGCCFRFREFPVPCNSSEGYIRNLRDGRIFNSKECLNQHRICSLHATKYSNALLEPPS